MHSLHAPAAQSHAAELRRRADRNHGHAIARPLRVLRWPRIGRAPIAARAERAPIGRPAVREHA